MTHPQTNRAPLFFILCSALLGCTGPAGPAGSTGTAGVAGPTGPAGSPDTASDIVAKLATVSVNANTLGGEPASAFLKASAQRENINVYSLRPSDGATSQAHFGIEIPNASVPSVEWSWVVPKNYVSGTDIIVEMVLYAYLTGNSASGCDASWQSNSVYAYRAGGAYFSGALEPLSGSNTTSLMPQQARSVRFRVTPLGGSAWQVGDVMMLDLFRSSSIAADTCGGSFSIVGVAMEYTAQ